MVSENLKSVRLRIARCCERISRRPEDIQIVCVTKGVELAAIEEALTSGLKDLGENRVQELVAKYNVIGDKARWHLVGHLQTNKVKDAVRISSLIHSVDSVRLAGEIDKTARKLGKLQDILIQVNASGAKTKFGIAPGEAVDLIKVISLYQHINIKGLMTIAPEVGDPELARPCFRALRELKDKINAIRNSEKRSETSPGGAQYTTRILSMGMTNDFEIAIEEGSNMLRLGRAIFADS